MMRDAIKTKGSRGRRNTLPRKWFTLLTHLTLAVLSVGVLLSLVLYFDNSGALARFIYLPPPTTPHNCIMSYTRPNFIPIQFCSPSNKLGAALETETCKPYATVKNLGVNQEDSQESSSTQHSSAPLGGDSPVNALGGSATAEGMVGFQLFAFQEGFYDSNRKKVFGNAAESFRDVPVLLVPGNAGSYYDARGMSSAIALGNVRRGCSFVRKITALSRDSTSEEINSLFKQNGNESTNPYSHVSPLSYSNPTPSLLGVQPFAAGFVEIAVVHNGLVLMRAAQHVRDSILFLRNSFLHHHGVLTSLKRPSSVSLSRKTLLTHALSKIMLDACTLGGGSEANGFVTTPAISRSTCELFRSLTESVLFDSDGHERKEEADLAKYHVLVRSAMENQLEREVDAVRRKGIWVIGHSLGGTAARLGAILALHRDSQSVAGIITLAGPNMFPPVFADMATKQLFASMRSYYNNFCGDCESIDSKSRILLPDASVLFSPAPQANLSCIASRRVKILSIGVGAFDKQVFYPSTSIEEEVMHSLGKGNGIIAPSCPLSFVSREKVFPIPSLRLDRSTEQLLGAGFTTTHHGINYCGQLFNSYAYGIGELVGGSSLWNAFPTFAADVDSSLNRSRTFAQLAEWQQRTKSPGHFESASVFVPTLPRVAGTVKSVLALIAFNRVVDEASDAWAEIRMNKGVTTPLVPIKVFRVPFRGSTNDFEMEDHYKSVYAESDAHASHIYASASQSVGFYHPTMVRTIALFELQREDADALVEGGEELMIHVRIHPNFPMRKSFTLSARATWLVKGCASEKWYFSAAYATSKVMHGTSPIVQLMADGHPILATPIEEFIEEPLSITEPPKTESLSASHVQHLRDVRQWALRHHHEGDDNTHIVFGGMKATAVQSMDMAKAPSTLCSSLSPSAPLASSSCAIPFAPPISYFDAHAKNYLFVALAPLLESDEGFITLGDDDNDDDVDATRSRKSTQHDQRKRAKSTHQCVEWSASGNEDIVDVTCPPEIRGHAPQRAAQRHITILDTTSQSASYWLRFGTQRLIRFAVIVQYYQILLSLFAGIFMTVFTGTVMPLLSRHLLRRNFAPNGVAGFFFEGLSSLQQSIICFILMDGLLALWFGFDAATPYTPPLTAVGAKRSQWLSATGSRDEWWGIPSTPEELAARFLVQCVGCYASYVVIQLLQRIGTFISGYLRNEALSCDASSLRTVIRHHWFLLILWAAVLGSRLIYFTHMDVPIILITLLSAFASIRMLQVRRSVLAHEDVKRGSALLHDHVDPPTPLDKKEPQDLVSSTLTRRAVFIHQKDHQQATTQGDVSLPQRRVPTKQHFPPLFLPRLSALALLHLVFTMFFFTIRNDVLVALAAAGQEQLVAEAALDNGLGKSNRGFQRPTTPSVPLPMLLKTLVTGTSGHFTPFADIKPPASREQSIDAWLLLLAFPLLLLGDSKRGRSVGEGGVQGRVKRISRTLSFFLIGVCLIVTLLVCQEPLEACSRSIFAIIPTTLLLVASNFG